MPRSQARARRLPSRTPDYESRLTRAREALKRARIAALLIVAPSDIRYLTGFSGEASTAILTHKDLVLISDFRFQEELEPLKDRCEILIRKGAMLEAQAQAVAKLKLRAIALQPEHLTLRQHAELRDVLGASRLRDAEGLMYAVRLTKDAAEIACIERAARIQQEALLATLPSIKPGLRERDIAARLEFEMKSRGADALSFDTIVAAKANGSKPHYRAGDEKTAKGKTLLIDWGARVEGYCADMTRVFALGSWPAKIREIYRIVLDAHLAAIDAVKPGASCAAVDAAARDIIINAGYGAQFGHGTGHGVGLDIHEAPRLFTTTNQPLQEGMVITIEPGIYLPGVGGVRIEDDILVTPKGARNLCTLPKNIEWATLHG